MGDYITVPCTDTDCGGHVKARFEEEKGKQTKFVVCHVCETDYRMTRTDSRDNPQEGVFYSLTWDK